LWNKLSGWLLFQNEAKDKDREWELAGDQCEYKTKREWEREREREKERERDKI